MINFDKYREKIRNTDRKDIECYIASLRGVDVCMHNGCDFCLKKSVQWLLQEYEPPLLKDGDGLKPGDWIMVRDGDDIAWEKRQFLYYFGDAFFCSMKDYSPLSGIAERWQQARLPEDGE